MDREKIKKLWCTVLSGYYKRIQKIGFQDRLSLNAGQKYCILLQGEQSAILSTFTKLPFVFKFFVLSIFEWPLKQSLTVVKTTKKLDWKKLETDESTSNGALKIKMLILIFFASILFSQIALKDIFAKVKICD